MERLFCNCARIPAAHCAVENRRGNSIFILRFFFFGDLFFYGRKEAREEGREEAREQGSRGGSNKGSKEGRKDGRKEGREEGRKSSLLQLI